MYIHPKEVTIREHLVTPVTTVDVKHMYSHPTPINNVQLSDREGRQQCSATPHGETIGLSAHAHEFLSMTTSFGAQKCGIRFA